MVRTFKDIDAARDISFAAAPKASTAGAGGNTVQMGFNGGKEQVMFKLFSASIDAAHAPYGVENANPNAPGDLQIKIELDAKSRAFIESFEKAIIQAGAKYSLQWFKKQLSADAVSTMLVSSIKTNGTNGQDNAELLKIKVVSEGKRPTVVRVATRKADGLLTRPEIGTLDDLKGPCYVLPVIRVANGVWFLNKGFGASLVADEVCVIRDSSSHPSEDNFAFSDVEMDEE